MKAKVHHVYKVEDAIVVMERIRNTENGCPRWHATVIVGVYAYSFNIRGYDCEEEEAKEAYRQWKDLHL